MRTGRGSLHLESPSAGPPRWAEGAFCLFLDVEGKISSNHPDCAQFYSADASHNRPRFTREHYPSATLLRKRLVRSWPDLQRVLEEFLAAQVDGLLVPGVEASQALRDWQ